MTALLGFRRLPPVKKTVNLLLWIVSAAVLCCLTADFVVSFSVRQAVYEDIDRLPYRPYAMVLGTSKYLAKGKPNDYYHFRLEAAKLLIDKKKTDYLLLSGDNRTPQYNEPRTMYQDLRKMGVAENRLFFDFAGFRTLDSVLRAEKIFRLTPMIIVSQRFHCERALFIAQWYQIDAVCFVAEQPKTFFYTRLREVFARVRALLDLIFGIEPHFLGEPEPVKPLFLPSVPEVVPAKQP